MQPEGSASMREAGAAVGRRMAERREAAGLSLESLAARLGLAAQELEAMEAGRLPVTAAQLLLAAHEIGVSGAALLGEADEGGGFPPGLDDPQAVAMLQAFVAIEARDVRAAILALVREMAETPDFRAI